MCLECGRLLNHLMTSHLRVHGLTLDGYRTKWGYDRPATFSSQLGDRLSRSPALRRRYEAGLDSGRRGRDEDVMLRHLAAERRPVREIAARTGMSEPTVRRRLVAMGIAPPRILPRVSDARLLELCRQGLWPSEIAVRLGLRSTTVSTRLSKLRRRGVRIPRPAGAPPNPGRKVTDEQLVTMLREGLRARQIAERMGMARMPVYGRLRRLVADGLIEALPPPLHEGPPERVSDDVVRRLAQQGLTTREIARRARVATVTVSRRLRRLRERGVLPPLLTVVDRGRPILELRRAGLWPTEIAVKLGMNPQTVRKWLWKLRLRGVRVPTPRRLPPNFQRSLVRGGTAAARGGKRPRPPPSDRPFLSTSSHAR